MLGDRARAITPEIPEPSSRRAEEEVKIECVVKGLVGEESQDATRGVIFQRTVGVSFAGKRGERGRERRTCACGAPAAGGREDGGGLVDGEVAAGDGEVD